MNYSLTLATIILFMLNMFDFNKKFFEKYQSKILFVSNKWYLRWLLGLHRLPKKIKHLKINKITPNSIYSNIGKPFSKRGKYKQKITGYFFNRPRFAEALAYNLSPFCYFANFRARKMVWRFSPIGLVGMFIFGLLLRKGLGLPFAIIGTTTDYAPSGDGYTYYRTGAINTGSGVSWASFRTGAAGVVSQGDASTYIALVEADNVQDKWRLNWRSHFYFDTSSLDDGATISGATANFYGATKVKYVMTGDPSINIYSTTSTGTTTIATADHQLVSYTALATAIPYNDYSTIGYNVFTYLDTANISKTGYTRLGTREAAYEAADIEPTWANIGYFAFTAYMSEETGTDKDPYLAITYTTTSIKSINGLAIASVKSKNGLAIADIKSINGLA